LHERAKGLPTVCTQTRTPIAQALRTQRRTLLRLHELLTHRALSLQQKDEVGSGGKQTKQGT